MAALLILGSAVLAALVWHYWGQLFEEEDAAMQRRLLAWGAKGLLVPVAVWFLINSGLVPAMPVLAPEVALAKARGGSGFGPMFESCALVLAITIWCWTGVSFAWMLAEIGARTPDRAEFKRQCLIWSALIGPLSVLGSWPRGRVSNGSCRNFRKRRRPWRRSGGSGCWKPSRLHGRRRNRSVPRMAPSNWCSSTSEASRSASIRTA